MPHVGGLYFMNDPTTDEPALPPAEIPLGRSEKYTLLTTMQKYSIVVVSNTGRGLHLLRFSFRKLFRDSRRPPAPQNHCPVHFSSHYQQFY